MGSFLSAAAFAFAIFEFLAFAKLPTQVGRRNFTVVGIAVRFTPRSAVILRYVVLATSVSLALFLALLLHELIGPLDAISRNRTNITLGLLWGPVFAIWVNSVLRHPIKEGLTRFQVVGGISLTVLFIVGSFGNGVGWFVDRYADTLSGVKIGVAELSFANKGKAVTPGAASSAPGVRVGNNPGSSYESSSGLEYVVHLHDYFIDPDLRFIKELFKTSNPALEQKFERVRRFAINYIEPPLSCLLDWPQNTNDAIGIETHLRSFANLYRRLRLSKDDQRLQLFAPELMQRSTSLVSDVDVASPVMFFCADLRSIVNGGVWIKQADVDQVAGNHEYAERPYFAIALAGLLAQLNQYQNAARILSEWLESHEKSLPRGELEPDQRTTPTPAQWLDIRARSILAAFMEEWLRLDEASVNTRLRDEHLANLSRLRRGLINILRRTPDYEKLRRQPKMELEGTYQDSCKLEGDLWKRIFASYTSIELTYFQNTLLHASYDERFAESSTLGIRQLLGADFLCLSDPRLFRAQVLEAYSRNAILYTRTRGRKDTVEARNNRLKDALRATEVGLEEARNSKSMNNQRQLSERFSDRISVNEAVAVQEALLSTKKLIEAFKEE